MGSTYRFHPNFASDLKAATDHYDNISVDLGNRFRSSVRDRLALVVESPELFGSVGCDFRGVLIKKFPYVVIYEVHPNMTVFVGIQHAASDRKGWFQHAV